MTIRKEKCVRKSFIQVYSSHPSMCQHSNYYSFPWFYHLNNLVPNRCKVYAKSCRRSFKFLGAKKKNNSNQYIFIQLLLAASEQNNHCRDLSEHWFTCALSAFTIRVFDNEITLSWSSYFPCQYVVSYLLAAHLSFDSGWFLKKMLL